MAYTPFEWKDGEEGGTPITAERLNHIEDGLGASAAVADGAAPAAHKHAAGDIDSGTLAVARIPSLAISKVTGLQAALDDNAAPAWGAVTGKPSTFPPATHTHTVADVTGLQGIIDDLTDRIEALEAE